MEVYLECPLNVTITLYRGRKTNEDWQSLIRKSSSHSWPMYSRVFGTPTWRIATVDNRKWRNCKGSIHVYRKINLLTWLGGLTTLANNTECPALRTGLKIFDGTNSPHTSTETHNQPEHGELLAVHSGKYTELGELLATTHSGSHAEICKQINKHTRDT